MNADIIVRASTLKAMLKQLKISQKEISIASGVDQATVSKIINTKKPIDKHSSIRYLTLFEDALLGIIEKRKEKDDLSLEDESVIINKFITNGMGQFLAAFNRSDKNHELSDLKITSLEVIALYQFVMKFMGIIFSVPMEKRIEANKVFLSSELQGKIETISLCELSVDKMKQDFFAPHN